MSNETKSKEIRSSEAFAIEVLRVSLDFNSQVVSIATSELAGEPSGKNRTHQRGVVQNLQTLGQQYSRRLDFFYDERERELRGEVAANGFSKEDTKAMRRTIAILDDVMQKNPNPEAAAAAASNLLELMLRSDEPKAEAKAPEEVKK